MTYVFSFIICVLYDIDVFFLLKTDVVQIQIHLYDLLRSLLRLIMNVHNWCSWLVGDEERECPKRQRMQDMTDISNASLAEAGKQVAQNVFRLRREKQSALDRPMISRRNFVKSVQNIPPLICFHSVMAPLMFYKPTLKNRGENL